MIQFKVRYCKAHMARYVGGDLGAVARRRVARYIDECALCHREYLRQRELAQQLESKLPVLGRPEPQQLDQIWSSLETELGSPARPRPLLSDFGAKAGGSFSFGLVALAISLALLLPLMIGFHPALLLVDTPPAPAAANAATTPFTGDANGTSAIATSRAPVGQAPRLQNTPAPGVQSASFAGI